MSPVETQVRRELHVLHCTGPMPLGTDAEMREVFERSEVAAVELRDKARELLTPEQLLEVADGVRAWVDEHAPEPLPEGFCFRHRDENGVAEIRVGGLGSGTLEGDQFYDVYRDGKHLDTGVARIEELRAGYDARELRGDS